jgi:flavodoxin
VYSYTGNTLSVAERIKEQIEKNGDQAQIHRITCVNGAPNGQKKMMLKEIPNVSEYDKLIIGAPINGFSICKALKIYFESNKIKASEVNCFVTQQFKNARFGGNRGIKQIGKIVSAQGSVIKNTAIVHWSSKKRDTQIDNTAQLLSQF